MATSGDVFDQVTAGSYRLSGVGFVPRARMEEAAVFWRSGAEEQPSWNHFYAAGERLPEWIARRCCATLHRIGGVVQLLSMLGTEF